MRHARKLEFEAAELNKFGQGISVREVLELGSMPITECGCQIWMRNSVRGGYGRITFNKKTYATHRVAWAIRNGPIPKGILVCHSCDIPSCINPDHLFLGTNRDNQNDSRKKGRAKSPLKKYLRNYERFLRENPTKRYLT